MPPSSFNVSCKLTMQSNPEKGIDPMLHRKLPYVCLVWPKIDCEDECDDSHLYVEQGE